MTVVHARLGRLWLVPAPLDFGCAEATPLTQVLPEHTLVVAAGLKYWICENAKTARAYLKRIGAHTPLAVPLQEQHLSELPHAVHKKGDQRVHWDARPLLQPALDGHDMGLLCEAGMPAVADPGASVVRAAHALGVPVRPLVGPSALLLGLAASGLNGQNFAFVGYLPHDPQERSARLRALEQCALRTGQTQLWIETPYRNPAMLKATLETLQPSTQLAVACGLTLADATLHSAPVAQWRRQAPAWAAHLPAVFALGR
ncbi:MAG: SAM-dependent methyltransferase [Rhodoferax sp.]